MKQKSLTQTWNQPPLNPESKKKMLEQQANIFISDPLTNKYKEVEIQLICIICRNEKPAGKLTDCMHKLMCLKCAQDYVINCIKMQKMPICLIEYCKATLCTKQSIFTKFTTKTHLLWKAFYLKSSIKTQGPIYQCQQPDCPGSLHPLTNICQICQYKHCSKCHRSIHQGECITISYNIENVENIKFCNFCYGKVTKQGGCPKIRCGICNRDICFQCLQEWSFYHHSCDKYGFLSLPFHFFTQKCCTDDTVNRHSEVILEYPRKQK